MRREGLSASLSLLELLLELSSELLESEPLLELEPEEDVLPVKQHTRLPCDTSKE